jgi:hypothetical protein
MGGAIFNMQGDLTIRNSTLTHNDAVGGIDNVPDHAKGIGGAVFNLSGTVRADASTFAANSATYDGASIYNLVYDGHTARTAQVTLRDTIVSGGIGGVDLASDKTTSIYPPNLGTATADVSRFDLVTSMASREQGTISGSALTADPQLGPLRDNGGPTATMALSANSPAIDAGAAFGLITDQRGQPRPSDFESIPNSGDGSDIGAYERQAATTTGGTSGGGTGTGGTPGQRLAFGVRTLVTLRIATKRLPAHGPLPVMVTNANTFAIFGQLSGATAGRPSATLRAQPIRVHALATTTVKLKLPARARRRLAHTGRLAVHIRATVHDPAGHARTVSATVTARQRTGDRTRR